MLRAAIVAAVAGLLVAVPGRASLYTPDEPMPFPVNKDGVAEALPFDEFKRRLIVVMNQANPAPPTDGTVNTDRVQLVERVAKRKAIPKPTTLDVLALSADLLRLGDDGRGVSFVDEALNLLKPRDNPRQPDYLVTTTLAHVHAARGEYQTAAGKQTSVHRDYGDVAIPAEVKGWNKAQRDWVAKLDTDYVFPYFTILARESEAKTRPDPEAEDVYPLFPVAEPKKPHTPVRFVNDAGQYEAGTIADAEKAKLPPDAIAVTQQMMFWFPGDTRLYWLLGELYAASGEIDAALKILNECVDSRKYSGRRSLMEHRAALMAAVEKRQRDEEERLKKEFPVSLRMIAIYFGVVAAFGVLAAVRAVRRRKRAA